MTDGAPVIVLCNGANGPEGGQAQAASAVLDLNYPQQGSTSPIVHIGLPNFVRDVYHLPDRVLDLLELGAYAYCADRLVRRGAIRAVEYHAWARSFHCRVSAQLDTIEA